MSWQRKVQGGVLGVIGYLLSPLSWWNDAFVNLPLAVGFGWLVALIYPPALKAAVVVAYWLTNVLGLFLMHKGAQELLVSEERKPYSLRALLQDVGISLAYTLILVVLIQCKVLKPIGDYF